MTPTTTRTTTTLLCAAALILMATALGRAVTPAAAPAESTTTARVDRGAYLVRAMGCNDCHTPWVMGADGPEADMSRALTGHPSDMAVPPVPALTAPWLGVVAATNTAWGGPWGVSFTANLTPDEETGLGKWTEEMFIQTMRTGRKEGKGRPLLPPMPYQVLAALTDEDITSVFAYLQSLEPVRNRVPQPIDPPEEAP